jgi:serine/threonine protein kinase
MADESTPASPTPDTPPPRTTGGGFRWEPPTAAELQNLMPGYTIEKILGRGGMGAVYRGVQTNLDRPVAIKILPPGVEKEDPSFAERFKSEARLMAKLNHPAVVAVYDFGTTSAGQLYFAMEYVDGSDVSQMIAAQGKLPPEHALAITAHVCDALSAAHELGIVHRDIKPANVLLNMKGQVKVADFGLAKVEDPGQHGLTKTGYAMGTPDFVAPEALTLGTAIDGRADLYAVGVMLYQMLTGNIPRGAFKPASVLVPGLDPRFDPIILKAMQHDREERHQNAAELRRELDVILTVPFVRNDAPVSAAIPVAQVAEAPGKRSAAQKPQPRSAGAPTRQPGSSKAGEGTRAPETPPKSKTPLFIGIAAAAAIGIGAFVMFSGKKDVARLSNVESASPTSPKPPTLEPERSGDRQPQAAQRVNEVSQSRATANPPPKTAQTAPTSKPPSPTVSKSALSPSTEPWQDVLRDPAQLVLSGGTERTAEGLLFGGKGTARISKPEPRDGAVRMIANYGGSRVQLRARETTEAGLYQLHVTHLTKEITLGRFDRASQKFTDLRKFPLPTPLQLGQDYELELRVVGQTLTVKFNGAILGTVTDSTLSAGSWSAGTIESTTTPAQVKALELLNLDASKPAAVAATSPAPSVSKSPPLPISASSDKLPPGQWVKVFDNLEEMPRVGVTTRDPKMTLNDGWFVPSATVIDLRFNKQIGTNLGIRGRFKPTRERIQFDLFSDFSSHRFTTFLGSGKMDLVCLDMRAKGVPNAPKTFFANPVVIPSDQSDFTMEFAHVGGVYVGRVDGKVAFVIPDQKRTQVRPSLYGTGAFRDIEVINLDGLPEAEALKILGVDEKGNDLRALAAKQEQQMAEQAKAVDAMAAIPELKALHEQFVKLTAERVTAPFEAEVAKLNAGYVGGIDREIASEKKAGHLDGVIALEAEKKLIADKQPIPAEDDAATTDALKKLRGIYRAAYAKIEAARAENLKALTDPLSLRLKQLEATLTQKDRIAHAKTVREYREGLGKSSPGLQSAQAASKSATTETPQNGLKSGTTLKKFPPGDDRKAAEWVLSVGGSVRLTGGTANITDIADLPRGRFELTGAYLEFSTTKPPLAPINDLLPLAGLKSLTRLQLKGLPLEETHLEIIPSLPVLSVLRTEKTGLDDGLFVHLAGSRLQFLSINDESRITGEGISALQSCRELFDLGLNKCQPTAEGLRQIGSLQGLTQLKISNCGSLLRDEHLSLLVGLKNLQTLGIQRTQVTAEGLATMKAWTSLTGLGFPLMPGEVAKQVAIVAAAFPRIDTFSFEGNSCGVEDFRALNVFPRLREFRCTASGVTDETLPGVLAINGLEELSFFQATQLTDASLDMVAKVRKLKRLEVTGCPQITEAAIAAFQKARPDVTVVR